jgi:hypothetical protein
MSRRFSIHEIDEAEINEAADFYDLESPGLGSVFLDEVQRAIENISQFPDMASLVRGRVRKKSLIKFPYSLIYSVRSDPFSTPFRPPSPGKADLARGPLGFRQFPGATSCAE